MENINCVLLIDDDPVTNAYNRIIIDRLDITNHIQEASDGLEALEYIQSENKTPNLIFLDINMPRMNGIQFLEAYDKLPIEKKVGHITIMLTASLLEKDRGYVETFESVVGFADKPLSAGYVENLTENYANKIITP